MKTVWCVLVILAVGVNSFAEILHDDVATAALWHMDTVSEDETVTFDDDSLNPGRSRDLLLTYPVNNETPPALVAGYDGNALLFGGTNIARIDNFWNSSYTEFKLDCMLYISALPTEMGALTTYLFTSSLFELGNWPQVDSGVTHDYMRLKIYIGSSSNIIAALPVYDLKNQWLHIVCSYSSSKTLSFSITDAAGNVRSTTGTGASALKAVTCGFNFGWVPGKNLPERGFRGMIDEVKISNKLIVPHYAFSASPANNSTITTPPAAFGWSKGLVADGSDVYFGTSSSDITSALKDKGDINGDRAVDFGDFSPLAATWQHAPQYPCADLNASGVVDITDLAILAADWLATSDPLFLGSTPESTLNNVPSLSASTDYYWRVASVNCTEVDAGILWKFTTGSAEATSPIPVDTATSVAVTDNTAQLNWTRGFGAEISRVYFGPIGYFTFLGDTSLESITSSSLLPNTTYYWQVYSISPSETMAGEVWSFTTGAIGATSPTPADNATNVTYPLGGVQLGWTSVFTPPAMTYDVYFGTTSTPPYIGSTAEPTFMSPAVTSNTTYYWRVDCISEFGNVTGTVWQFKTATPAFPTAEGFGKFAKGGRGGTVYHVTTLANSGAGSLRDAVSVAGRTIVFDVGGQITVTSRLGITVNNLTIAGQTAPGDGISIAGYGISVGADDLIIRYIRVRYTSPSTSTDDCFSLNNACDNVIVDHVSTSWGTDEVFSIAKARFITAQWCIIAESQNSFGHSKGSLFEGPQLTMHHCLYAHNNDRNPKSKGIFDYRNNVAYDWGFAPYIAGGGSAGLHYANCVGNYYISGSSTTTEPGIMVIGGNLNYSIYLSDNRIDTNRNGLVDGLDLGTAIVRPSEPVNLMPVPFAYPPVVTESPESAYQRVLSYVGCSKVRDSIDTRIINEVVTQTGGIINSYLDVGGLGTINGGTTPTDTDQDGMPNTWETAHGLNINDAADRNYDPDGDGYTNLEDYLNSLTTNP